MRDHSYFANLIWQIADLLRGPYRPPQYERVMLPMTVLRRFDCVLAPTKAKVLAAHKRRKGGKLKGRHWKRFSTALPASASTTVRRWTSTACRATGQRRAALDQLHPRFLRGCARHFVDHFDFGVEIEKMAEANILYFVVSKFREVDLHPDSVPNEQMGLIFENLIRRFNELANETAGDHFTPARSSAYGEPAVHPRRRVARPPAAGRGLAYAVAPCFLRQPAPRCSHG